MKKKFKSIIGTITLSMALLVTVFATKQKPNDDIKNEGGDRESIIVWSIDRNQK